MTSPLQVESFWPDVDSQQPFCSCEGAPGRHREHIGRIRLASAYLVTRCGDDASSLVARLVSENHQPVVEGEATGLSTRSRPIGRHRYRPGLNHFTKDVGIPPNLEAASVIFSLGKLRG